MDAAATKTTATPAVAGGTRNGICTEVTGGSC
jgi:hypothetical protein